MPILDNQTILVKLNATKLKKDIVLRVRQKNPAKRGGLAELSRSDSEKKFS